MHRVWVTFVNLITLLASILFIIIASAQSRHGTPRAFSDFATSRVYNEKRRVWIPSPSNPTPLPPSTTMNFNSTMYVIVLDFESKPVSHHCLYKRQWIDPFLSQTIVENVEIYSLTRWSHRECELHSLAVPRPPTDFVDLSGWLFVKALEIALNRSQSAWLFVVRDSAYIRVEPFFEFFTARTKDSHPNERFLMFGGCIEKRYFFQMLTVESGIFISRKLAQELLSPSIMEVWSVVMSAGIQYDEALAHLSDQVGIYMKSVAVDQFLGRSWRNASHFQLLANKSFDQLPDCVVPRHYIHNAPGELGLCSSRITKMNSVITWSATDEMDKTEFLRESEHFLNGNPDNLGFYWDRTKPTLCRITENARYHMLDPFFRS
jgi:hypothetical protein